MTAEPSPSPSDSSAQRDAERLIREKVAEHVGKPLTPERIELTDGTFVDMDGVAPDRSVLVEIFAHQGRLKGGQRHKIAGDALKLITVARASSERPRMILAFADEAMATWAAGKSWLAASLKLWEVDVVVVELDQTVRDGLRRAQARQVMINPPLGVGESP